MIIAAIPVGFCAGLFGIGGGLISVPFLFFIFDTLIIDKQYKMDKHLFSFEWNFTD